MSVKADVDVLIAIRLEQGLSQRKLALKAGVNNSTISRMEKGVPVPTPRTAHKICVALGRDFYELFSR